MLQTCVEFCGKVRKMKSQLVFVTFMTFVSIAYYLMAYGQATNGAGELTLQQIEIFTNNVVSANGTTVGNVTYNTTGSPYLLNKPHLCSDTTHLKLLILVVTAPNNSDVRMAIRRTWGTVAHRADVRLAFVLGRSAIDEVQAKLAEEDHMFGDILQGNFLDAYYNLTLKSVMILKWAKTYCPVAQFVLKIDDDCFLHPINLLKYLEGLKPEEKSIYGRVWKKVKPIRDKKEKWSVPVEVFPDKEFPDYTGGPSYVISQVAIGDLLRVTSETKPLDLEDIYITGICAQKAKIARVNDNRFNVGDSPLVCASRDVLSYHRVAPDMLHMLWWATNDHKFATCSSKDKTCDKSRHQLLMDLTNLVLKNMHN